MKGCFKTHSDLPDVDPNFRVYYHRVKGEIKLIAEGMSSARSSVLALLNTNGDR